jgi:integrase/recombinase XerD
VRRQVVIPDEDEAQGYERAAGELPRGKRAMALLALKMGFRAEELCSLDRLAVQRAVKTGELIFMRKGGKEQLFQAEVLKPLFEELLAVHAKTPRRVAAGRPRAWQRAGEILSTGGPAAQYNALHALVRDTGRAAGLTLRPHLLRHAFATRMERDGASLFTIQAALNHANIQTTQRYVHPSAKDIARFIRA